MFIGVEKMNKILTFISSIGVGNEGFLFICHLTCVNKLSSFTLVPYSNYL